MPILDGKRCLVTGGSRGLGRAISVALAKNGGRVSFTYSKNDADADETARLCDARAFKGDVTDGAHVGAVVETLEREWGGIDVLVCAAGVMQVLPVALIDEADWDRTLDVNVKGAFLFARAALRGMIKRRAGSILFVGSFGSERIMDQPVHYAAAKAALRGLAESLAREVGRYGVRVNLLAPGLCSTGIGRMLPRHRTDEYLSQAALGRLAEADEIAAMAAWIVSDENTLMTGAKIVVDGGL